ncbi:hypothetical protein SAMN05661096_02334 [Marivirga sericea]|uniref:Uncharacterized protein n=1 Tax=Marivirga sericea TaxID=1028 RepID=A0A1X7K358_9BACT|nr:hypothetical protein SAMN05661096_02334 [Marivirga sericea]
MWKNKSICSVISLETSTLFKQTPNFKHEYLNISQYFQLYKNKILAAKLKLPKLLIFDNLTPWLT